MVINHQDWFNALMVVDNGDWFKPMWVDLIAGLMVGNDCYFGLILGQRWLVLANKDYTNSFKWLVDSDGQVLISERFSRANNAWIPRN